MKFALLSLLLVGCAGPKINSPNATPCTASGRLFLGLDCAETNTGAIHELSYLEAIDFMEPQPERTCVPLAGFSVCADSQVGQPQTLPARSGAIIISDNDYTAQKTAFEQACVELRDRCTPEMKESFRKPTVAIDALLKGGAEKRKKKGL